MTDPTRDEVERVLAEAMNLWDDDDVPVDYERLRLSDWLTDALIKAGLVVPAGMIAEKLRNMALRAENLAFAAGADPAAIGDAALLLAWADVLELRETPE